MYNQGLTIYEKTKNGKNVLHIAGSTSDLGNAQFILYRRTR